MTSTSVCLRWLLLLWLLLCPTLGTWSESLQLEPTPCVTLLEEAARALESAESALLKVEKESKRRSDESAKLAVETAQAAVKEAAVPLLSKIAGLEDAAVVRDKQIAGLYRTLSGRKVGGILGAILAGIAGVIVGAGAVSLLK